LVMGLLRDVVSAKWRAGAHTFREVSLLLRRDCEARKLGNTASCRSVASTNKRAGNWVRRGSGVGGDFVEVGVVVVVTSVLRCTPTMSWEESQAESRNTTYLERSLLPLPVRIHCWPGRELPDSPVLVLLREWRCSGRANLLDSV
jgi:hypothetical protein